MRMWMVNPEILCNQHLLGEHAELHKHLWCWRKKHRIDKRIAGNAIEPSSYKDRHDALEAEMKRRGMKPKSPIEQPDFSYLSKEQIEFKVDVSASLSELTRRCSDCSERAMVTD